MPLRVTKYIIQLAAIIAMAILLYQCANPVSPGGGPRDTLPPQVLSSTPPNNSVFFDKQKISITFDEFVKLKNPNQQVLISPPLVNRPEYKLKGKSLVIELDEVFMPNTTYTIFFGNAIVDIAEENPLANYLYSFSTGSYIDSLAIAGEVVNAFDLVPLEEIFVLLFPTIVDTIPTDSIPMLARPLYVAKTDVNGQFQLRNLRNQQYRLFALRDVNSNYRFDQPNEEIAFLDSLITPEIPDFPSHEPDSLLLSDSIVAPADSLLVNDTIDLHDIYHAYYQLRLFVQIDSTQRLLDQDVFYPPKFRLNYKFPARNPHFKIINKELEEGWEIEQLNANRDSLLVWVKDLDLDSLQLVVMDADSILDTLMVTFAAEKEKVRSKNVPKKGEEEKPERIKMKTNLSGSTLHLGRRFRMIMDNPLQSYDFSNVKFIAIDDTMNGAPFVALDSINRVFELDYELEENSKYSFIFPDSILFDIYGLTNDSLQATFNTGKISDYGNLEVDIRVGDVGSPYLVQLLGKNEKVLQQIYIYESQKISFLFLKSGIYMLKAIQDVWRNKQWDTGLYIEKRQPENVFYFPAQIQVRANWDMEESWQLP